LLARGLSRALRAVDAGRGRAHARVRRGAAGTPRAASRPRAAAAAAAGFVDVRGTGEGKRGNEGDRKPPKNVHAESPSKTRSQRGTWVASLK
jgi:hypothetical protein